MAKIKKPPLISDDRFSEPTMGHPKEESLTDVSLKLSWPTHTNVKKNPGKAVPKTKAPAEKTKTKTKTKTKNKSKNNLTFITDSFKVELETASHLKTQSPPEPFAKPEIKSSRRSFPKRRPNMRSKQRTILDQIIWNLFYGKSHRSKKNPEQNLPRKPGKRIRLKLNFWLAMITFVTFAGMELHFRWLDKISQSNFFIPTIIKWFENKIQVPMPVNNNQSDQKSDEVETPTDDSISEEVPTERSIQPRKRQSKHQNMEEIKFNRQIGAATFYQPNQKSAQNPKKNR